MPLLGEEGSAPTDGKQKKKHHGNPHLRPDARYVAACITLFSEQDLQLQVWRAGVSSVHRIPAYFICEIRAIHPEENLSVCTQENRNPHKYEAWNFLSMLCQDYGLGETVVVALVTMLQGDSPLDRILIYIDIYIYMFLLNCRCSSLKLDGSCC